MKVVNFTNPKTNSKISLNLDVEMIFVYGKNGSGKTTLSRSNDLKQKNCLVFNEDFINKNVYVITNDGAQVNQETNNNLSDLLIGETAICLKKKIILFENKIKECKTKLLNLENEIKSKLIKNQCNENDYPEAIIDESIKYNGDKTIDEQFNEYKYIDKTEYNIKSDDELSTKVQQLQNFNNYDALLNRIQKNNLLNCYIFNDKDNNVINEFNDKINLIQLNKCKPFEIEKLAKEKNIVIDNDKRETIRECLKIQQETKNDSKCFLCGTNEVKDQLDQWNKILNDEYLIMKDNFLKDLKDYIEYANSEIIKNESLFKNVAPKTIEKVKKFVNAMVEIQKSITIANKKNKILETNNEPIDERINSIIVLKSQIIKYLLKDYMKQITFYNSFIKECTLIKEENENKLNELLMKDANDNVASINGILTDLKWGDKISLTIDRLGKSLKYKISFDNNRKIKTFSDGERHKLGLAIFLNWIGSKNKEKDQIIVFDDPVVSLDVEGYHSFKDYVINNIMKKDNKPNNKTLIILTHNFNYFYVQISNLIYNKKLQQRAKIYKLYSNAIRLLDFHLFELDDFAFFKECLQKMKYRTQLCKLSKLYEKIFRLLLDVSLRLSGKIGKGEEPTNDIDELKLEEKERMNIKDLHKELTIISHKNKATYEESCEGLKLLKKIFEIFNYKEYITDDNIKHLDDLLDKNDDEQDANCFIILDEIVDILNQENTLYAKYLRHPKTSFIPNILATALDKN